MRRLLSFLIALSLFLLPSGGLAQDEITIPDTSPSRAFVDPGVALACPAGDGPSLAERGLVVRVRVLVLNAPLIEPVPNYPHQDIWLDDNGNGDLGVCPGGSIADADTDAEGFTYISSSLRAGGWTQAGSSVYISGVRVDEGDGPLLPLDINSPDLDGDLSVNMVDVALFASDLATASFRSDLDANGVVDLIDVGIFASHIGHTCP